MVQNKCDRLEMQIVDDILGNLTEEAHRTLHHHLATCHDCRRRYDEWRRHLQDASNTTPSPRVYHRLRRRVRWQYVRRTWFRPAAVMASVASGATVALLCRRQPVSDADAHGFFLIRNGITGSRHPSAPRHSMGCADRIVPHFITAGPFHGRVRTRLDQRAYR